MAKKRKASRGPSQPKGPREVDPKESKLTISSYADVADSQDEFLDEQDHILFDDEPMSKKQRRVEEEDAFLESEDDALDYGEHGDGSDSDGDKRPEEEQQEEADSGWWGSSKKEYYNADEIQTEQDALEEEKEAVRLQKKKLAKMTEEDFIFDQDAWLAPQPDEADVTDGGDKDTVTEVLSIRDIDIPDDMPKEERLALLQRRYPELSYLADELVRLQPLLQTLQREAQGQPRKSLAVIRYRILASYVATLAMYFATLAAPARHASGPKNAMPPAELREHEVMQTLLECREAWQRVQGLTPKTTSTSQTDPGPSPAEEEPTTVPDPTTDATPQKKVSKATKKKRKEAERQAKEVEASLAADLGQLMTTATQPKAGKATKRTPTEGVDNDSDFGEEESLDAQTAADKAARKKSLRFYTSQIVQKANRRAGAGRDAGGDADVPYRERLKDRQARLNVAAEKRGRDARSDKGTDLPAADAADDDDESDDGPQAGGSTQAARSLNGQADEYYDMVAAKKRAKRDQKQQRKEAVAAAAASGLDRVVEQEEIGADGKRKITYAIEKNKGLAPRRKKEVRNPRVKKRIKYDEKKKKLRSMKATYSGGQGGHYAGELTGIKPGLIKSVKL